MSPNLYNGLALAYIGDAIYELRIRDFVLSKGLTKVNDLNKLATHYTMGQSQAYVMRDMLEKNMLSEEEIGYFKRGRNSSIKKIRKNISRADYLEGTGFESLIGYLYLSKNLERMDQIISYAIELLSKKED